VDKIEIITDENGNKIVLIPDIIFANKQNIEWKDVENYLERYIGRIIEIANSRDIVYIGKNFPDEYTGSKYTRKTRGARAKAKANAVQGVSEMVEIATEKTFRENHKDKHNTDAGNGWYYFTTRFALPLYDNETKTSDYNVYSGRLVINCASSGKMYLYDLVDIKKETSNPLKTND
jgi:hypothetical protein